MNPSSVLLLMSGIYLQFHFCYFVCLQNNCVKALPRVNLLTSTHKLSPHASWTSAQQLKSWESCLGRRQNTRWEIPGLLVLRCWTQQNNRDVKVASQHKRDVIGKWALEQHSPLTHQLLPGWPWLPTAMGRNSPGANQQNRSTELRAKGACWCILFSAPCCLFLWQVVGMRDRPAAGKGPKVPKFNL